MRGEKEPNRFKINKYTDAENEKGLKIIVAED